MSEQADWSEYWQQEGAAGEVFVTADGKKHTALSDFWKPILAGIEKNESVVDIASGAGSVFSNLSEHHALELHATDISPQALALQKQRIPGVITHVESASQSQLDEGYFDRVLSQFGIEYAGLEAFRHAGRLLTQGGRLHMLCHIDDGFIYRVNRPNYLGAELINKIKFISFAKRLTLAAFDQDQTVFELASRQFTQVEPLLADFVNKQEKGLHTHLYQGFKQLFEQRNGYHYNDIMGWLDAMQQEVDKTYERIGEIFKAMLTADDMEKIKVMLHEEGLGNIAYKPLQLPGHDRPVAWHLSAVKTQ